MQDKIVAVRAYQFYGARTTADAYRADLIPGPKECRHSLLILAHADNIHTFLQHPYVSKRIVSLRHPDQDWQNIVESQASYDMRLTSRYTVC